MKNAITYLKAIFVCVIVIALEVVIATAFSGCRVVKIEKNQEGYRLYHNSHWLSTEADQLSGSMDQNGTFNFSMNGVKSTPSEEFNKMMQTNMGALTTIAQLAATAYNPAAAQVKAPAATQTPSETSALSAAPSATPSVSASTAGSDGQSAIDQCADGSCNIAPSTAGSDGQSEIGQNN
ncbi:MAG: hypothetical protein IJQ34_06680 [Kiritimatiellae bacterium]|nr:hypothetical protein [Kiritimatiellia bacterium]